ncbi:hypothetical protein HX057_10565 [Myroides odoratimimus]|uniref:hypothetical protein n=1 Tax=Myroides odoratimimus TaxID=76832 RepID=UPI000280A754|nr:hypothetical protein [Myroides odoratimimus]EKB07739.1 hypothetical protein HMPREF9711_00029 [Myroides odoratimimus CCUG 3837]MCS7473883.1 hypothetical protein [Myroides odoratimimus]MDM1066549.1 hypothetical protein [Myroides odoratimimus]MDM1411581.1 hypothetical protein [Myroides odoratimimus]MDM1414574.1 hypothetical protein [Myroides odoratimimus]
MSKSTKTMLFLFIVIMGFVYFIESNKVDPIDWRETLDNTHKIPFGTYILDQEIDKVFPNDSVIRITGNVYDFFKDKKYDSIHTNTLFSLKNYGYIDSFARVNLHHYIAKGNTAVIFQDNIDGLIEGIETDYLQYTLREELLDQDKVSVTLANPNISTYSFQLKDLNTNYFDIPDSLRTKVEVLGYLKYKGVKYPNLIRYKEGSGQLILGLQPIAFTNYNLLESNNHLYVQGVLSYLPQQNTYFTVSRLPGDNEYHSTSILRFVFKHPALTWAWYFFLGTLFVFIIFTAKRKQRVIPIITPLSNTTVEFTKTVSNLYIQNKDYEDLINKHIIYTLEKIRRVHWLDTTKLDEVFINNLHIKTKKDKEDIIKFVRFIEQFKAAPHHASEEMLIELNKIIEKIID